MSFQKGLSLVALVMLAVGTAPAADRTVLVEYFTLVT